MELNASAITSLARSAANPIPTYQRPSFIRVPLLLNPGPNRRFITMLLSSQNRLQPTSKPDPPQYVICSIQKPGLLSLSNSPG